MTTTNLDQQITDAEHAHAALAQSLVDTESAIIAGDPKRSLADIEALERESRATELHIRALEARRDADQEAKRLSAINSLREEVEASKGADLAKLLRAVEAAASAFNAAVNDRNARIYEWRTRLLELGVDPATHATTDGSLAPSESVPFGIYFNAKFLAHLEPQEYVHEAIMRASEARPMNIYDVLIANSGQ